MRERRDTGRELDTVVKGTDKTHDLQFDSCFIIHKREIMGFIFAVFICIPISDNDDYKKVFPLFCMGVKHGLLL
jgi:hypothetical protein